MISLKNISIKFDHRGIAGLHGIDFTLGSTEVFAILGPNGSGKTTLLNILLDQVESKETIHLFKMKEFTSDENVQKFLINAIKLQVSEDKKLQLARDLADIFEFTFQLRQNLSQLSAGQRQKVLMSCELINQPKILLLDEPFSHLDPFTRREILRSLFLYLKNQQTSVVWVTHDLNDALEFSDRVGILNFGKWEQIDSAEKILMNPKNLFVAQYMGYKNFLPIKFEENSWQTPWGKWNTSKISEKDEALMVIPLNAWDFEGPEFEIMKVHLLNQSRLLEVTQNDRSYWVELKRSDLSHEHLERIKLTPRLQECFLIPL